MSPGVTAKKCSATATGRVNLHTGRGMSSGPGAWSGRFRFLGLFFLLRLFFLRLHLVLDVRHAHEESDQPDKDGKDGNTSLEELDDLGPPLQAPRHEKNRVDREEDEDH